MAFCIGSRNRPAAIRMLTPYETISRETTTLSRSCEFLFVESSGGGQLAARSGCCVSKSREQSLFNQSQIKNLFSFISRVFCHVKEGM
ncbi:hypothetical protein NPIL_605721 [Nephila pilipes]|uniref:Uncharacterized protein n=1 Tax=Nephila pilipes TaxID=299642 RepID=A0A8X6Q3J2_NEPPI|nr:hypothetical protein NPIL_605721 [Nephila pilipes]